MDEDLSQYGNPHGDEGMKVIKDMNAGHTPQIMWGVDNLPYISPKRILDVGCGGGIFTRIILEKYPNASASAIDISELCVDYAKEYNKEFIDSGRLDVQVADVMDLPFEDGTFDMVVSNASHFFWNDLKAGLRELGRVTKMGGTILLTAGLHFDDEPTDEQRKEYEGMANIISDLKLKEMMTFAGFRTAVLASRADPYCAYIGIRCGEIVN